MPEPGAVSQETNTLHVVLPPGASLRSATDALKRFGDVSHVEVLPGQRLTVSAVFFDVLAAARARAALGPGCCQPARQTGCRSVRLPGNAQLELERIRGVSRVSPEPDNTGAYLVEFYDLRDAARAQEFVGQPAETLGTALANSASDEAAAKDKDASEASVPAYVKPSPAFGAPANSSCGLSQQAAIVIRGLPKALCTSLCLEAMFEQAGLEGTMVNCRIRRGHPSSEVLVSLTSRQAARRCIQHFHGRSWIPGERVSCTFAKGGGKMGEPSIASLRLPQKAPLPEDAEAEAAEEAAAAAAAAAPPPDARRPPSLEAPPGICAPVEDAEAEGEKLQVAAKERSPSLATDESTADGASMSSDQEEAKPLAFATTATTTEVA